MKVIRAVVGICTIALRLTLSLQAHAVSPNGVSDESTKAHDVAYRLDSPTLETTEPYAIQKRPLFEPQPRPGMLQNLYLSTTRLIADTDQLGMTQLDLSATFGCPLATLESPLLITPSFGLDGLDVDSLDLPDDLYEASLEVRHIRPLGGRWKADLRVSPGVYGNTETSESQFRVQGRAIGIYQWRPDTKALLGVIYLDREDISLLPAAGLIWTPTDYCKVDLLFPKPRIAIRGMCDSCSAWWIYLGGDFGGGSWGVTRANAADDVATISDQQFLVGMERQACFLTLKIEAGYAFSRKLEYSSGIGDVGLDSAPWIRGVLSY